MIKYLELVLLIPTSVVLGKLLVDAIIRLIAIFYQNRKLEQ